MRVVLPVLARLLSALLALALIAGGVVLIVEVVAAWVGAGWTILPEDTRSSFEGWSWDDRPVVITTIVVGVVGLLALLLGLWRRPPLTVPVEGCRGAAHERRALEGSLTRELEHVDGVSGARVRVGRRSVAARVHTNRRFQPGEVKAAAERRLAEAADRRGVGLPRSVRLRAPEAGA